MSTKKDLTDEDLLKQLESLDDDLWDPGFPQHIVDEELKELGLDPKLLAEQGRSIIATHRDEQRPSWQSQARLRRQELEARAAHAESSFEGDREAVLARLNQLRQASSAADSAITMAARKRKPEQSSVEELRALLQDVETLRALERK